MGLYCRSSDPCGSRNNTESWTSNPNGSIPLVLRRIYDPSGSVDKLKVESTIQTDSRSGTLGSDPAIRFLDPRPCLIGTEDRRMGPEQIGPGWSWDWENRDGVDTGERWDRDRQTGVGPMQGSGIENSRQSTGVGPKQRGGETGTEWSTRAGSRTETKRGSGRGQGRRGRRNGIRTDKTSQTWWWSWIPKTDPGIWSKGAGSQTRLDHKSQHSQFPDIHWDHRSVSSIMGEIHSDSSSKTPVLGSKGIWTSAL